MDFIASSTATGRGLGVFRREKRVKLRPKTRVKISDYKLILQDSVII